MRYELFGIGCSYLKPRWRGKKWTSFGKNSYLMNIGHVVEPVAFERHTEPSANAVRIIGRDARGEKCFGFHSFVLVDGRFDADEFPVQVDFGVLTSVPFTPRVPWGTRGCSIWNPIITRRFNPN